MLFSSSSSLISFEVVEWWMLKSKNLVEMDSIESLALTGMSKIWLIFSSLSAVLKSRVTISILPFLVIFKRSIESGPFALVRRSAFRALGCELGMLTLSPSKKMEISLTPLDTAR